MSMPGAEGSAQVGVIRAFVTDGGAHPPETLAAIDLCQIVSEDSNPAKRAEIAAALAHAHEAVQVAIRNIFATTRLEANEQTRKYIIEVIARGIATSLNNERELFKG